MKRPASRSSGAPSPGDGADRKEAPDAVAKLLWLGPSDMVSRLPIRALAEALRGLPPARGIETASLGDLEPRVTGPEPPHAVLSPLFWQDGDVLEAARLLWALEFRGPYRIVTPPLPRPAIVEREIRAVSPGLDIGLIFVQRR